MLHGEETDPPLQMTTKSTYWTKRRSWRSSLRFLGPGPISLSPSRLSSDHFCQPAKVQSVSIDSEFSRLSRQQTIFSFCDSFLHLLLFGAPRVLPVFDLQVFAMAHQTNLVVSCIQIGVMPIFLNRRFFGTPCI